MSARFKYIYEQPDLFGGASSVGYGELTPEELAEEEAEMERLKDRGPGGVSYRKDPPRPRPPKADKTYAQAKGEMLAALRNAGWKMSDPYLKVPHATSLDGKLRLWFKAQAVHSTDANDRGLHDFGNSHTFGGYDFDIRKYDGPRFLAVVERIKKMRDDRKGSGRF